MRTWMRETREDLARYRANASQSLQVRWQSPPCSGLQNFASVCLCGYCTCLGAQSIVSALRVLEILWTDWTCLNILWAIYGL